MKKIACTTMLMDWSISLVALLFLNGVSSVSYFDMEPQNTVALQDDPVTLECKIELDPIYMYNVAWFKNGKSLAITGRITYLNNYNRLHTGVYSIIINRANYLEDEGTYMCKLYSSQSNIEENSQSANLAVVKSTKGVDMFFNDIKIREISVSVLASNVDETFKCVVSDVYPVPSIRWFLGTTDITSSSKQTDDTDSSSKLTTSVSTLNHVFQPGKNGDNGKTLSCPTNILTVPLNVSTIYKLNVLYKAHSVNLNIITGSARIPMGSTFELKCEADANPPPTFTWKVNGNVLPDAGDILTRNRVRSGDSGEYECVATTNQGSLSSNKIDISVAIKAHSVNLSIITGSARIPMGSTFELKCEADANPPPTFTWKVNGNVLPDTGDILARYSVMTCDSGGYECVATTTQGSLSSNKIDISVANFAFSAHTPAMDRGENQDIIKFNYTRTNIGDIYDPCSGKFTAPSPGTYFFETNLHIQRCNTSSVVANIWHNGNDVAGLHHRGTGGPYENVTVSSSVILNLESGDEVWVTYAMGRYFPIQAGLYYSGVIIYPDQNSIFNGYLVG